ncbi:MAG: hypothetical protein ACKO1J_05170, partial [Tagaea sp.]
ADAVALRGCRVGPDESGGKDGDSSGYDFFHTYPPFVGIASAERSIRADPKTRITEIRYESKHSLRAVSWDGPSSDTADGHVARHGGRDRLAQDVALHCAAEYRAHLIACSRTPIHRCAPLRWVPFHPGYKEGVAEAMKSFTNVKTYSLPWPM